MRRVDESLTLELLRKLVFGTTAVAPDPAKVRITASGHLVPAQERLHVERAKEP